MSAESTSFALSEAGQRTVCKNLDDTDKWAGEFARQLRSGDVVALSGELGAGKSTLIRMLVRALGYPGVVSSPTFTLMNVYQAEQTGTLYHFDFYRLGSADEARGFGADEFIGAEGIVFIEWADKFPELLPEQYYEIHITIPDFAGSPTVREISLRRVG